MAIKKLHIFNIEYVSEEDECSYVGTFSCKRLSIRDRALVAVTKTRLNGGYHHDEEQPGCGMDQQTEVLNHMLAHMEVALTDTPPWWDLDEIGDFALVTKVYEEVATFQNSFRKRAGDADGGREAGSPQADQGADAARAAGQVVAAEVPASLEP